MFLVRYHLVSCLDDAFLQTKRSLARYHLPKSQNVYFLVPELSMWLSFFKILGYLGFGAAKVFLCLFFYPVSAERLHY